MIVDSDPTFDFGSFRNPTTLEVGRTNLKVV